MTRLFYFVLYLVNFAGFVTALVNSFDIYKKTEINPAAVFPKRNLIHKRSSRDYEYDSKYQYESNGHYVLLIKHPSCANMTQAEFLTIFAQYPNVRVRCEAEGTILSPSTLNNLGRELEYDLDEYSEKNGVYRLIESGVQQEVDRVFVRFPIGPCVRPTQAGTGQLEMFVTLNTLAKRMREVSGNIPIIDMSAGRKQSSTTGREFIYSTLCTYKDMGVRPAVELLTQITRFQTREWIVELEHKGAITKSEWKNSTAVELAEGTLAVACLSERYVENVCLWTEVDAMLELTEYFTDKKITETETRQERRRVDRN